MLKALRRTLCLWACAATIPASAGIIDQTLYAVRKSSLPPVEGGVRILLERTSAEIPLSITGAYGIYDAQRQSRLSGGLISKSLPLRAGEEGIAWGESFPDRFQITIVPESKRRVFRLQDREYPGILHVYQIGKTLQLVNEVTPEEFALAIVDGEGKGRSLQVEAATSLAICARTLAIAMAKQRTQHFWHLEALRCGYRGYLDPRGLEEAQSAQVKSKGLILISRKFKPYLTEWTEDCAGNTADYDAMHRSDEVFPHGGARGIASPWAERHRERSRWKVAISRSECAQILDLADAFDFHLEKDPSERKVIALAAVDRKGKKHFDYYRLHRLLEGRVASSEFNIQRDKNQLIFTGYGRGSGVGLCLLSARAMAEEGQLASEILSHFFPDGHLVVSTENQSRSPILAQR